MFVMEWVEKKLTKGWSVAEIADMLEESEETIQKIVEDLQNDFKE